MKILTAEQGTPEWLAARRGRVTASRVSDVTAKGRSGAPSTSRQTYMAELITEILTGEQGSTFKGNADTEWGHEHEPLARAAYEVKTDCMVEQVGLVLHPRIERAGASPDGLVDPDGLLEIKCPRTHTHIDYLLGKVPPAKYVPQMAWQCACTGRKWVDFLSFDPRMPAELQLFLVRYEPSTAYLAELEDEVCKFLAELDAKLDQLKAIAA